MLHLLPAAVDVALGIRPRLIIRASQTTLDHLRDRIGPLIVPGCASRVILDQVANTIIGGAATEAADLPDGRWEVHADGRLILEGTVICVSEQPGPRSSRSSP